jgi:hypothetical protein
VVEPGVARGCRDRRTQDALSFRVAASLPIEIGKVDRHRDIDAVVRGEVVGGAQQRALGAVALVALQPALWRS